jgi:hypothetical protein
MEAVSSNSEGSSSSSSGSSGGISAVAEPARAPWKAAVVLADRVASIAAAQVAPSKQQHLSEQHGVPRLQDSISDKALQYLLLYDLAACAAALYAEAEQRSKQQGRPELHHVQLLQQLGLGGLVFKADRDIQIGRTTYAWRHMVTASMGISDMLGGAEGSTTGSTSSSSSRVGEVATGLQQLPAAAGAEGSSSSSSSSSGCGPLEAAAMLTLMQCMLLPLPGEKSAWFHSSTQLLCSFLKGLAPSARTAAATVMLQPFVTQLLPAGLSALKAAAAAAAAAASGTASSSSSSSTAARTALQQQPSSAAVTAPMPAQLSFWNAARVLKMWLSTGDHCSIFCMAQHLVIESSVP